MPQHEQLRHLLVLTAMPKELVALIAMMEGSGSDDWAGITATTGTIAGVRITAFPTGVGKVRASAGTQYAISRFEPELVLSIGAAGSLSPSFRPGHVVVGQHVVEHDFNMKQFAADPESSFRSWEISARLCQSVADAVASTPGVDSVGIGTILTGDQVVSDPVRKRRLVEQFRGDCVEMEGAAVAAVCHQNQRPFAAVRIISDNAGHRARSQFLKHLPTVSSLTRDLVYQLVRRRDHLVLAGGVPEPDPSLKRLPSRGRPVPVTATIAGAADQVHR
jgi:adenosylhomocysteine nucleosidase